MMRKYCFGLIAAVLLAACGVHTDERRVHVRPWENDDDAGVVDLGTRDAAVDNDDGHHVVASPFNDAFRVAVVQGQTVLGFNTRYTKNSACVQILSEEGTFPAALVSQHVVNMGVDTGFLALPVQLADGTYRFTYKSSDCNGTLSADWALYGDDFDTLLSMSDEGLSWVHCSHYDAAAKKCSGDGKCNLQFTVNAGKVSPLVDSHSVANLHSVLAAASGCF